MIGDSLRIMQVIKNWPYYNVHKPKTDLKKDA